MKHGGFEICFHFDEEQNQDLWKIVVKKTQKEKERARPTPE